MIRRILVDIEDEGEMVEVLAGVVLCPRLLFRYIQRHRKEDAEDAKSRDEDSETGLSEIMGKLDINEGQKCEEEAQEEEETESVASNGEKGLRDVWRAMMNMSIRE
jgi:hypothetical protein